MSPGSWSSLEKVQSTGCSSEQPKFTSVPHLWWLQEGILFLWTSTPILVILSPRMIRKTQIRWKNKEKMKWKDGSGAEPSWIQVKAVRREEEEPVDQSSGVPLQCPGTSSATSTPSKALSDINLFLMLEHLQTLNQTGVWAPFSHVLKVLLSWRPGLLHEDAFVRCSKPHCGSSGGPDLKKVEVDLKAHRTFVFWKSAGFKSA